jgi:hypothetical protein
VLRVFCFIHSRVVVTAATQAVGSHCLGLSVGRRLGLSVGRRLGLSVGRRLGLSVGRQLGLSVGRRLGLSVGRRLGLSVGRRLGLSVGRRLGLSVGRRLGLSVGRGRLPPAALERPPFDDPYHIFTGYPLPLPLPSTAATTLHRCHYPPPLPLPLPLPLPSTAATTLRRCLFRHWHLPRAPQCMYLHRCHCPPPLPLPPATTGAAGFSAGPRVEAVRRHDSDGPGAHRHE